MGYYEDLRFGYQPTGDAHLHDESTDLANLVSDIAEAKVIEEEQVAELKRRVSRGRIYGDHITDPKDPAFEKPHVGLTPTQDMTEKPWLYRPPSYKATEQKDFAIKYWENAATALNHRGTVDPVGPARPYHPYVARSTKPTAPLDTAYMFSFNNIPGYIEPAHFFKGDKWDINARLVLPVPPETFAIQSSNSQEEVTSVTGQVFTHAGPTGLAEMSIESFFPSVRTSGVDLPPYVPRYVKQFGIYTPQELTSLFITAMNSGQPLEFTVSVPEADTVVPAVVMITRKVTVVDFQWEIRSGHGQDRFYTMTLKEWTPQTVNFGNTQGLTRTFKVGAKTRTLGRIADFLLPRKFGSKGAIKHENLKKWKSVYELNKEKIDKFIRDVNSGKVNPKNGRKYKKKRKAEKRIPTKVSSRSPVLPVGFELLVPKSWGGPGSRPLPK